MPCQAIQTPTDHTMIARIRETKAGTNRDQIAHTTKPITARTKNVNQIRKALVVMEESAPTFAKMKVKTGNRKKELNHIR